MTNEEVVKRQVELINTNSIVKKKCQTSMNQYLKKSQESKLTNRCSNYLIEQRKVG